MLLFYWVGPARTRSINKYGYMVCKALQSGNCKAEVLDVFLEQRNRQIYFLPRKTI
jgi:hypothetical protein